MNTDRLRQNISEINALLHIENELREEEGEMAQIKRRLARQELLEKIKKTKRVLAELQIENSP